MAEPKVTWTDFNDGSSQLDIEDGARSAVFDSHGNVRIFAVEGRSSIQLQWKLSRDTAEEICGYLRLIHNL